MENLPDRQEEYIQYLYNVINILKQKLGSSELQCKDYANKLKHTETLCDEKEKFILYQEAQLTESLDTINKLKQRISELSSKNMSAEGGEEMPDPDSDDLDESREPYGRPSGSRRRSRSRSIVELISLETLPNNQLLTEIKGSAEELQYFALGVRTPDNIDTVSNLRDRISTASDIIHSRLITSEEQAAIAKEETLNRINHLQGALTRTEESLEGAQNEIYAKDTQIQDLNHENVILRDNLNNVNIQSEQLERNCDRLIGDYRRRLTQAEQEIDNLRRYLNQAEQEIINRGIQIGANRLLYNRLRRQKFALSLANRQLQIRLTNALNNPPPPPQRNNEVWLIFH